MVSSIPKRAPADPLGEIYRAVAVIRATGGLHAETVDRLQELLPEASPEAIEPYLDLARGQIRQKRYLFAQDTLNTESSSAIHSTAKPGSGWA